MRLLRCVHRARWKVVLPPLYILQDFSGVTLKRITRRYRQVFLHLSQHASHVRNHKHKFLLYWCHPEHIGQIYRACLAFQLRCVLFVLRTQTWAILKTVLQQKAAFKSFFFSFQVKRLKTRLPWRPSVLHFLSVACRGFKRKNTYCGNGQQRRSVESCT